MAVYSLKHYMEQSDNDDIDIEEKKQDLIDELDDYLPITKFTGEEFFNLIYDVIGEDIYDCDDAYDAVYQWIKEDRSLYTEEHFQAIIEKNGDFDLYGGDYRDGKIRLPIRYKFKNDKLTVIGNVRLSDYKMGPFEITIYVDPGQVFEFEGSWYFNDATGNLVDDITEAILDATKRNKKWTYLETFAAYL